MIMNKGVAEKQDLMLKFKWWMTLFYNQVLESLDRGY